MDSSNVDELKERLQDELAKRVARAAHKELKKADGIDWTYDRGEGANIEPFIVRAMAKAYEAEETEAKKLLDAEGGGELKPSDLYIDVVHICGTVFAAWVAKRDLDEYDTHSLEGYKLMCFGNALRLMNEFCAATDKLQLMDIFYPFMSVKSAKLAAKLVSK